VNRPKFYKSFRSRRYHESKNLQASIQDLLNESKKIILDIGFGTGESTIDLNDIYEDHLVCGVEAYKPGIQRLNNKNIPNHYGDALEFIEQIDKNTISKIYMLFPDPWQKKKHRKRRLLNEYTFSIINKILLKEGMLHFATDNINYAIEARDIIRKVSKQKINFSRNRNNRPVTKYEIKALSKNKFVFDIIYKKN
jgi:tRNA (guanine-N7-)-methyltransferase